MKTLLFTGLLIVTLLLMHILSTVTATRIFCRAPPVSEGDPATLTCHFPQDLNQSRKSIAVVRRDSIPGSRYELVIGCIWDGGTLLCDFQEGYQIITQQLMFDVTFQIPSQKAGTFRCTTIPADKAVTVQSCNFSLKATRIFCRVPPIPEGDPATLTCHFPEDLSQIRKDIAVFRRDSIPGSQYERVVGCVWGKEKLACGIHEEIKLITRQPMYDVTFQIASRQPGTFRCHITPEDEAVTVQSCNFKLEGPYRDTTDWSQRRNEDGYPLGVTTIVCIVMVTTFIAAVVMTLVVQRFCGRRSRGSASPLVLKHGKRKSQTELGTKAIQSCGSASHLVLKHWKGESQTELAMKEIQSCDSSSPLVLKYGKGESQTELAIEEIQPAGNALVGEPKSTKGKAKCK